VADSVETDRLLLRRIQPDDMDAYFERIYADPDVTRTLPPGAPIPREAFDRRISGLMVGHWETHGFGPWVVVDRHDDQLLGHCGLKDWPDSEDVEVLYAIARSEWGRGIATEAARASVAFGFDELGLETIIGGVLSHNTASRRVLEKLGMHETGPLKFRDVDVVGYAVHRADFVGEG
jgi:ribosomal-protein-alanine N-acetyltransferase